MPSLFDTVVDFFRQDQWPCQRVEGHPNMLQMKYQENDNDWSCYAHALEDEQEFVFYSLAPLTVPPTKRWLALEYISRANYNLPIGGFEMDIDQLLIRYKTSIDVEGDRLSQALFRAVVYSNVAIMEQYLPGLKSVLSENVMPRDAIAAVEGG